MDTFSLLFFFFFCGIELWLTSELLHSSDPEATSFIYSLWLGSSVTYICVVQSNILKNLQIVRTLLKRCRPDCGFNDFCVTSSPRQPQHLKTACMSKIQIVQKSNLHQIEDLVCLWATSCCVFWYFIRDNFACLLKQHRSLSAACQLITEDTCSSSQQTSYCHTWAPIIVNSTMHGRAVEAEPHEIAAATGASPPAMQKKDSVCAERDEGAPPCHGNLTISDCILQVVCFSYAVVLNRCVVWNR